MADHGKRRFSDTDLKKFCHKAELPLHAVSLAFSLAVYGIVTYLLINYPQKYGKMEILADLLDEDETVMEYLLEYGPFFIAALLAVIFLRIIWEFFKNIGETVSNDVPVSDTQYPELKEACASYAEKLGATYVPELYVTQYGDAAVEMSSMTIKSRYYIRLNCYYVMVAYENNNLNAMKFLMASELAHIALKHRDLLWVLLTIPARILPVFRQLYSRARNYSADRIAQLLVGEKEAVESVVDLSNDAYMGYAIDRKAYVKDIQNIQTGWQGNSRFYYNLLSDMPVPAYRIEALMHPEKDGRLF